MKKKIVWFTGLSGAGKTTLANALILELKKKYNVKKKILFLLMEINLEKKRRRKIYFLEKI